MSFVFASCMNAGESSTMKCVLLGLLGLSCRFISRYNALCFGFNPAVMQCGNMRLEIPRL